MSKPCGKAEFGLLAALLLFFGAVGGLVSLAVKSYRAPEVMAVDRPSKRNDPANPTDAAAGVASKKPKYSVTIVADPKTVSALDNLRDTAEGDSIARPPKKSDPTPTKAASYADELDVDSRVVAGDSPEVQSALEHLKRYRTTGSWQEKLPLVYQTAQTKSLMEQFYGSRGLKDPEVGAFIAASDMRIGTRKVLSLSFRRAERLNLVEHVNFHRTPAGLLLDWESLVGFSARPMREFRAERSVEPTLFRVRATADDYYNFEFADSKKYLSLRLYTSDGEDYLNGYCERESPTGKKLVEILGGPDRGSAAAANASALAGPRTGTFPITVELVFPDHAQSDRCVKVDRFVSAWWLALESEKSTTVAVGQSEPSVTKAR